MAHTTIMRWIQRFVPEFEKRWNRFARKAGRSWRGRRDLRESPRQANLSLSRRRSRRPDIRFPASANRDVKAAKARQRLGWAQPLPHEDTGAREQGNEPARAGLQPEAHDRDPGYEPNDEGDQAAGGVSLFNGRCNALGDSGACQATRFGDEATG